MPRRLAFRLLFYVIALASMTFAVQTLAQPTVAASSNGCICFEDSDCSKGYVCTAPDESCEEGKGVCLWMPAADASSPRNLAAPFMAK